MLALGLVLVFSGVAVYILQGRSSKRKIKWQYSDQWLNLLEKQVSRTPLVNAGSAKTIILLIILCPLIFLCGLQLFGSVLFALLSVMIVVLVVDQKMAHQKVLYNEKINRQLTSAARVFAAEYSVTPQLGRAIRAVAERVPEAPLGPIFARAYKTHLLNKNTNAVLEQLFKELPTAYGFIFVQLMQLADKGAAVVPLFSKLASKMTVSNELSVKSRSESTGERLMSLVITVAPLPAYLILMRIYPDSVNEFLNGTFIGRLIMFLSFASTIVFATINKYMEGDVL